ncbi:hypothetical protein SBRCBS47491_002611 [Sporothrix bragantina]|uniref:Major facilitator superfamily transporter n=1 Tax=Sporothrix bragantina TaxID=671064 RepID=A0ABP0B8B3_9PEZI
MDRRDPYRDTSPVGTADELLLQGDRYRDDAFNRDDDDETLPFLSPDNDNYDSIQHDAEGQQSRRRGWGWRRPAWLPKSRPQPHYEPVRGYDEDDNGNDNDNSIAPSEAETDVEAEAGPNNGQRDGTSKDDSSINNTISTATWYQAKKPGTVVFLVALILFFLIFAATLALVPMMRLIEDAICRRYYGLDYGPPSSDNGNYNSNNNNTTTFNTHLQFIENDQAVSSNSTDERMCKVDAVQAELAWLGGVVSVTEAIFGLLASFPWALLSDRIGRKPVFRIAFIGVALSFGWTSLILLHRDTLSVWWVLTCEVFLLVGGGAGVTVTILHAIIVDVLVSDRASGFIWLAIGAVVGSIVGPTCAALLMMNGGSAWVPICITLFVVAPIILVLSMFLPETLPKRQARTTATMATTPSTSPSSSTAYPHASFWTGTIPAHIRETLKHLQKTLTVLRRSRPALLLLPSFLFTPAIQGVQGAILAQSVSKRFGWSLAQTGYLFSFRGIVTVVVLVLIPFLSKYILGASPSSLSSSSSSTPTKRRGLGMTETAKDLLLARVSLVCLVAGNILMAASTTLGALVVGLVLSTLAVGFGSLTRSLITFYFLEESKVSSSLVSEETDRMTNADGAQDKGKEDDDHTSRLYTLTGMVETFGSILAGPLLAWTFSSGLTLGGGWIGLPFYYVASLCIIALVCLFLIRGGSISDSNSDGGRRIRLSTTGSHLRDRAENEDEVGNGQIALP